MSPQNVDPQIFQPRMPEVDIPTNAEEFFARARQAAAEDTMPGKGKNRHIVIVTPGRMLMLQPTPAPGTMKPEAVAAVEKIMSSKTKRNVAVIAYTELTALQASLAQTIPFVGLLMGLAYIGHAVWIFEGHSTVLAAGCRESELVIADNAMIPFLQEDWVTVAAGAMKRPLIFAHERATFSLKRVYPPVSQPGT